MTSNEVRNIDELIELFQTEQTLKFQLFWGHTPRIPGKVDQSCLSNWFPAAFEVDGISYPTAEHYMMAEKARLFNDEAVRSKILKSSSPGAAKKLGRSVADFDETIWTSHRFAIVVAACYAKFSQNDELRELLLRTGSKVLVEASPTDRIWGIGLSRDHKDVHDPSSWKGLNLLGFALMEARGRLRG